jgi:hypothetical protein
MLASNLKTIVKLKASIINVSDYNAKTIETKTADPIALLVE